MERTANRIILAFVTLLGVAFAHSAAAADKKNATPIMAPAPPPAMPQNVKVTRGQKIDIPLRTFGRHNETLQYVIRSLPAHGRLSEPRAVDRATSMVTYEPPADFALKSDRFLFAVKTSVGVSAPVEVTIAIVDEAPVLTIPDVLDYGSILAGGTAMKQFELANRGGGLAEGEVKVPAPWKVEGRSRYQLAGGESATFKILFAPTAAGNFRGEIIFTSNREHSTALNGSAAMPVSAEPAEVLLRHEPGFVIRTGVFEVVNRTGEARTFRLDAGPRLRVEPQIAVPAGGRLAVAVSTDAADVASLDDVVKVETEGFSLSVPVKAAAVGPILRVAQQRVTLGRVPADRGGQIAIEIENSGGTPAAVVSEIAAPFAITPASFLLPPGEKRQVALAIRPAEAGPYRGWLKLKAAPVSLEVEIEAELGTESGAPRASMSGSPTKRPERTRENPAAEPEPWTPDLNIVKGIRVSEVRPTTARIEWLAEMSTARKFRIERLMVKHDAAGELRKVWLDVPQIALSRDGPQWSARMSGLAPAQSQTLRVVPIDRDGNPGTALFSVDFFTPEQPRGLSPPSLLQGLIAALVVALGFVAWKRKRKAA